LGSGAELIRFEGVTKRFGAVTALDDVSLTIRQGEFFCLVGPSGCGKSTLLRLLAGLEEPDGGRVLLDARDLAGTPAHRRPVNMMFQSYALFPHMNVAANVGYGLKHSGLPKAEIASRVADLLRLVRLDEFGARYPAQLSGGQRQRVALARALARRPRVLLLDEPLGALDRRLREATQGELKALQARLGTTFIMVTHDQGEAMSLADRIAVLDRGRPLQVGPPRELYDRPANRFVAEFLGDVNLLEGRVLACQGCERRVELQGGAVVAATAPDEESFTPGEAVALAIRPEALQLEPRSVGPAANALDGEVVEMGFLGPTTSLTVRLQAGPIVRVLAVSARVGEVAAGALVTLRFAPSAAAILR
jgi:putrescine transport system ATP-binding protein